MTRENFPDTIKKLKVGIVQAKASKQTQGVNQLQIQFLSRLQKIHKSVNSVFSMITAVESTLSPPQNWRAGLDFASLESVVRDFDDMITAGTFDIVGKYDNIDVQLDPVVQRTKNECNNVWVTTRNTIFSTINLDFEAPNARVLKAIDPTVNLPASFFVLQKRLNLQKNEEFGAIWKECGDDSSEFQTYVTTLSNSIREFNDAVNPVLDALSKTNPKVSQFLSDATRGEATMRQANSQEVQAWLAQDQNLLDSFLVRFKDGN